MHLPKGQLGRYQEQAGGQQQATITATIPFPVPSHLQHCREFRGTPSGNEEQNNLSGTPFFSIPGSTQQQHREKPFRWTLGIISECTNGSRFVFGVHTVLPVGDFLRELQMMGVERMLVPMFAAVIFRPGGRDDDGDG
uniref:Uncharacterized protein n=1 Tax=Anopheles coluzzii TaxID=1518534 RepID=A0A8W7PMD2_ANOCL